MLEIQSKTTATPLQKGDQYSAAAISSVVQDKKSLSEGLKIFEEWGLVCNPQNLIDRSWGYFAGTDDVRFADLHPMPPPPLIAFARGGWGAARLLERKQPWEQGWLLGYSDITSILLSRVSAGFDGAIHGPLITSLSKEPDWSKERLKALLFGVELPVLYGETWTKGVAKGPLIVGNLTVATHLLGSRHMPDLKGAILILEDTNEAPYRIDRMLTHWRLTGDLKKISGLGFGDFHECKNNIEGPEESARSFSIQEILIERCCDLGIPILGNLPIGHCCGNAAMPLGRSAVLNGDKGTLTVLPS